METKRKFEEEIKTRMEEWDEQIRELKIQTEKADPERRSRYQNRKRSVVRRGKKGGGTDANNRMKGA